MAEHVRRPIRLAGQRRRVFRLTGMPVQFGEPVEPVEPGEPGEPGENSLDFSLAANSQYIGAL